MRFEIIRAVASWNTNCVCSSTVVLEVDAGSFILLKLVVCILLCVLGQVQDFRLTQHSFEYFIQ
jgi:hypothetical protein